MQRFIPAIGALAVALCVGLCAAGEPQGTSQPEHPRLRFAQASLRVAEAEYEQAQVANKKVPGSVTAGELRRLALHVEKERLALAEAGRAAYRASQTRKQEAVSEASNQLADACLHCHEVYRDKRGGTKTDPSNKAARCTP